MQRYRYHHHYYPHQRTAYGPRSGRARQHHDAGLALSARELYDTLSARVGLSFADVSMPHGGKRLVVICPSCERRCAHLYLASTPFPWACRRCTGLVYWSQYEGRRPEAADNIEGLGAYPMRALTAVRHGYRGWQAAITLWRERSADHDARATLALAINQLRFARYVAYVNWQQDCYDAAMRQRQRPPAPATLAELAKRLEHLRQQRQRGQQPRPAKHAA